MGGRYAVYVGASVLIFAVLHKFGCQVLKTIVASFILLPPVVKISMNEILDSKILAWIGSISFEVYLAHMKVYQFMGGLALGLRNITSFLLVTVFVAAVLHFLLGKMNECLKILVSNIVGGRNV